MIAFLFFECRPDLFLQCRVPVAILDSAGGFGELLLSPTFTKLHEET